VNDIVLITIDCWRHDAPERMPNLRSFVDSGVRTEAITPAEATPWVSTSLFHSQFHVNALQWTSEGFALDTDAPSLVEELSEKGYETGAFVADNPNLRHYADHFDTYWDGTGEGSAGEEGADAGSVDSGLDSTVGAWLDRLAQTALLRKSVSATDLAERASEWYADADGPRFLWMHLMEPHSPYYAGLRRGLDTGLLDTYRANVEYFRNTQRKDDLSDRAVETLPECHWQCVERLDDQFPRLVEFLDDDAMVAITGDHGEALHHDWIGHVELYDETVRVPLFLVNFPETEPNGLPAADSDGQPIRQYDLAPTILDAVGEEPPEEWRGVSARRNEELHTPILTTNPAVGAEGVLYLGMRDERYKLLKTYDVDSREFVHTELFDLEADPGETTNVYGDVTVPELEAELDAFVEANDAISSLIDVDFNIESEGFDATHEAVSEDVQNRLVDLGYA
jgi:arylsulfatase A-like enzyme